MTSFGFGGPALSKDLVPISEALTCTIGGKDFTHDDVYILLGLKRCQDLNNKCVRICRPPCGADEAKLNIHGGACAQGHPVGSTGSRIIVSLMYALKKLGKKRGIASLCIGGGEATAVAIEMV